MNKEDDGSLNNERSRYQVNKKYDGEQSNQDLVVDDTKVIEVPIPQQTDHDHNNSKPQESHIR